MVERLVFRERLLRQLWLDGEQRPIDGPTVLHSSLLGDPLRRHLGVLALWILECNLVEADKNLRVGVRRNLVRGIEGLDDLARDARTSVKSLEEDDDLVRVPSLHESDQ